MNKYVWAEITPEKLLEHVAKDLSYADIARMYGISRNTVSGLVYRWKRRKLLPMDMPGTQRLTNGSRVSPKKLEPKLGNSQPPEAAPANPSKTGYAPRAPRNDPPPEYKPYVPRQAAVPTPKPTNPPVGIMQLTTGMCAVVVSGVGEEVAYCGCKPLRHLKFRMCAHHAEYMIVNEQERRRNQAQRRALQQLSK